MPLSTFVKVDTSHHRLHGDQPPGPVPAVTISFNLARRTFGQAVDAIHAAQAEMNVPATLGGTFAELASVPRLAARSPT